MPIKTPQIDPNELLSVLNMYNGWPGVQKLRYKNFKLVIFFSSFSHIYNVHYYNDLREKNCRSELRKLESKALQGNFSIEETITFTKISETEGKKINLI